MHLIISNAFGENSYNQFYLVYPKFFIENMLTIFFQVFKVKVFPPCLHWGHKPESTTFTSQKHLVN